MVSQYIKDSRVVNEAFDCDFVNLSTSRSMEEIGKGGIKKLFRFLASYLIVLWKLITHRYSLCYLAITCHGMGFLKDAPFVLLCKLFCRKVVLHQHNKGLSRDVARWPYRWLMPLVYRNTTVMLLSWHLYEDVASVVKREQVVVCANGIPEPHPNPLQGERGLGLPDEDSQRLYEDENEKTAALYENDNADARGASVATVAWYESATCDEENFSFPEECCLQPLGLSSQRSAACCPDYLRDDLVQRSTLTSAPTGVDLRLNVQQTEYHPAGNCPPNLGVTSEAEGVYSQLSTLNTKQNAVPRLLFLSNLIESKGIYVLLEACRMLKEEGIAFQCDYVGGESKMVSGESFRAAIAAQGLADCVTYHGPQYGAAKERFFREADIFVFPTFYDNECFPLVLVEAMQHKLPVISTMEGAIPDIVTDGVNGFVCAQRDVQALAVALRRLIGDGQMRVDMGQRGYEMYREGMTLEAFEKRFTVILLETVENS